MNLMDKKMVDLTAAELEQLGQATTWIITMLLEKVVDANAKQTSQLIAPLIAISMDLDLARITQPVVLESDPQMTQHGHLVTYHNKTRQVWYCEGCRRVGCIGIDPTDLCASLNRICDDHAKANSACARKNQNRQIRIVNSATTRAILEHSVPSWATNHICQFLGL